MLLDWKHSSLFGLFLFLPLPLPPPFSLPLSLSLFVSLFLSLSLWLSDWLTDWMRNVYSTPTLSALHAQAESTGTRSKYRRKQKVRACSMHSSFSQSVSQSVSQWVSQWVSQSVSQSVSQHAWLYYWLYILGPACFPELSHSVLNIIAVLTCLVISSPAGMKDVALHSQE